MKELFKALSGFQQEVPTIHENTKGYNYTYADLNKVFDTIRPIMKKHGLMTTQYLLGDSLVTIVAHVDSGENIESSIIIPKVSLKGQNEFQSLGSGITYMRRYSLSCLLGLITDKDADGSGQQAPKPIVNVDYSKQENSLKDCKTLQELGKIFKSMTANEQSALAKLATELKLSFA